LVIFEANLSDISNQSCLPQEIDYSPNFMSLRPRHCRRGSKFGKDQSVIPLFEAIEAHDQRMIVSNFSQFLSTSNSHISSKKWLWFKFLLSLACGRIPATGNFRFPFNLTAIPPIDPFLGQKLLWEMTHSSSMSHRNSSCGVSAEN
jgi:hypothetical protein